MAPLVMHPMRLSAVSELAERQGMWIGGRRCGLPRRRVIMPGRCARIMTLRLALRAVSSERGFGGLLPERWQIRARRKGRTAEGRRGMRRGCERRLRRCSSMWMGAWISGMAPMRNGIRVIPLRRLSVLTIRPGHSQVFLEKFH